MGDGWSIAWRVHDAQFWGVPQRRKRIALVADFGGLTAPEILFERKGVSGDIEQSRKEKQGTSPDTETGIDKTIYDVRISSDGTKNWRAHCYEANRCRNLDTGGQTRTVTTEALQSSNTSDGDIAETLDASYYKGCGERQGKERTVVYGISAYESNSMKSDNPHSGIYEAETTRTLDNNGGNPACNQGGMIVLEGNGTRESHKGDGYKESETMFTLNTVERHAVCVGNGQMANMSMKPIANSLDTMHDQQAVMTYGIDRASFNQGKNAQYDFSVQEEVAQTIVAKGPGGGVNTE